MQGYTIFLSAVLFYKHICIYLHVGTCLLLYNDTIDAVLGQQVVNNIHVACWHMHAYIRIRNLQEGIEIIKDITSSRMCHSKDKYIRAHQVEDHEDHNVAGDDIHNSYAGFHVFELHLPSTGTGLLTLLVLLATMGMGYYMFRRCVRQREQRNFEFRRQMEEENQRQLRQEVQRHIAGLPQVTYVAGPDVQAQTNIRKC